MAIFKRNRNKNKNKIIEETPAAAPEVREVSEEEQRAEMLLTAAEQGKPLPDEEQTGAEPILPVIAYGTENEEKVNAANEGEVEDEIDSIAGIFGSDSTVKVNAKSAAFDLAADHPVSAAQSRWFDRRRRAIEQARAASSVPEEPETPEEVEKAAEVAEAAAEFAREELEEKRRKKKIVRELRIRNGEAESLAFADLTARDDLEAYEINEASDIYGIKYPKDFDTSKVNYTGRPIDFSDFSRVSGLRWDHIEGASDITGVIFPATFDIDRADFYGRNLRGCDFSAVYSMKWKHIEAAEDIAGIRYPSTFDIGSVKFFTRNISGSDFSLVSSLEWENIWDAADISGLKYPAAFDMSRAELEGRDISGSDLSLLEKLSWDDISAAADIRNIIYPASFDIASADFSGRDISGSDFTRLKAFSFDAIKNASCIDGIKYPDCFDSSSVSFRDRSIKGSNFSRVATLRFRQIKDASDIRKLVYPPQFDIGNADFSGMDIDDSDFSLLSEFSWQSVYFAESRENIMLPSSFRAPQPTTDEVQGAMLIFLLKLHNREYRNEIDVARFNADISDLFPGVDEVKAAELIEAATAVWEQLDGQRRIEITAREGYTGDKLFMTKLGFKLLYPRRGGEAAVRVLREQFIAMFRKSELKRFERRLDDLRMGKYLSAEEIAEIGYEPVAQPKAERSVPVPELPDEGMAAAAEETVQQENPAAETVEETAAVSAVEAAPAQPEYTESELAEMALLEAEIKTHDENEALGIDPAEIDGQTVYTFGQVGADVISEISDTPFVVPDEPSEDDIFKPVATSDTLNRGEPLKKPAPAPAETPAEVPAAKPAEKPAEKTAEMIAEELLTNAEKPAEKKPAAPAKDNQPPIVARPVDLSKLREQRAAQKAASKSYQRREKLSDEEKAIRTGVMGVLLYIHQNTSEQELSNSELYAEFMKIYPGSQPKEAAAMAQFATNTLGGTDTEMRAKLFMFASRASAAVKRRLLDFAFDEYVYRLSETADEEIFRDFLRALCDTLYEDSPEYEYSSYLRSKDILKDPPLRREASYRRIPFENNIGKANLYANERYPYNRTLEQVGFQHYSFDAIRGNLLIEVSDSRVYEELENLVYREKEPNLLQFVVVETQMGYLYLEQRCISEWKVDERDIWAAAEHNMSLIDMKAKYSFASSEFSSFRYIQHDLASYILCDPEMMEHLSCGQDLIIALPCREIAYIDFYDFAAIKKLIEFNSRYNCTLIIGGEEYEHPFSQDIFIYHAESGKFERVNDETYILLGDSVARRQVLRAVLPLNIDFDEKQFTEPLTTDEAPMVSDEQCVVQEAAFTLLRLYAEMNGERDYTVPQNAFMAIVDEVFISFDAVYPPPRGREQPDPMEHLEEAARMVIKGGKTLCWLLIQAMQFICGDIKYETPSAAHIRETVLNEIYNDNANAVWLNCATAADFTKRFDAMRPFHEQPVENNHLTILDSKVEVAMHVMTMIFHQFSNRYALGEVRRHMSKALPDMTFTYEINQSAWLPSPGENVDVDAQSLGMIFRGFDRATQERMLSAFADAIGDRDLSEGGWPLLYFIKFVKYSYLDPVEMIERYFVLRSRLIPSRTVLKQLYYKDLNNEFVKHARRSNRVGDVDYSDAFEEHGADEMLMRSVEGMDTVIASSDAEAEAYAAAPQQPVTAFQRPDVQLVPVENGYLEKRISFVLEEVDGQISGSLREAAHYVTKIFHVPEVMFKTNDDIECELHYGIIRSREQITTLRSFAWTLSSSLAETNRRMGDVTESDIMHAVEVLDANNRLNYKPNTAHFPSLCSMPLDEGMYIPSHQEYIYFAQDILSEVKLASLFSLQDELMMLAPAMKLTYDILREQKRGEIMPPRGVLFDVLCAWSAYCFASGEAFEVVKGPQMYNYNQIVR